MYFEKFPRCLCRLSLKLGCECSPEGTLGAGRGKQMPKRIQGFHRQGQCHGHGCWDYYWCGFYSDCEINGGDLINPFIGLFMGGVDFTNMFVVLSGEGTYASLTEARDAGAAVFAYDAFIMAVINFLIIAFVVFMMVRYVNKVK